MTPARKRAKELVKHTDPADAFRLFAGFEELEAWQFVKDMLRREAEAERKQIQPFVREIRDGDGRLVRSREQVIDQNNISEATAQGLGYAVDLVESIVKEASEKIAEGGK